MNFKSYRFWCDHQYSIIRGAIEVKLQTLTFQEKKRQKHRISDIQTKVVDKIKIGISVISIAFPTEPHNG